LIVYEQNFQITLFDKLCYEVLQEKFGDRNFYTFGRSIPDKSRKWTNVWNGDPSGDFEGLAYSLTSGIRSGLMGFSQWGSDTGGYNRKDGQPTEEVWARWMWFSAFSPMYEFLLGKGNTPWYSPYTSVTVTAVKQTSNLHHDLIPYIRSFTYEATQTGIPVMRALFLEAPDDSNTWNINDEYFFGSEFLIAPIITEGGERTVYFPEGTKYLEYFNKTDVFEGGDSTDVALDLTAIPAYVTAGAIVARGDVVQGNAQWIEDWAPQVNVEFYPSFDVPQHSIGFWTGEEQVSIEVAADSDSKTVKVTYGALGLDATYEVYTKNGTQTGTLDATGGQFTLTNVESLFG
jgi:alpha-D-xyloside xylohydrolase